MNVRRWTSTRHTPFGMARVDFDSDDLYEANSKVVVDALRLLGAALAGDPILPKKERTSFEVRSWKCFYLLEEVSQHRAGS